MRTQIFARECKLLASEHKNIETLMNFVGQCLVDLVNFVWNLIIYSYAIPLGVANDYKLQILFQMETSSHFKHFWKSL